MNIDRTAFFARVRASGVAGHPLKPRTVESLEAILDRWQRHFPKADIREVAYSMATARHEAWSPRGQCIDYAIEEIGGASRPYGKPMPPYGKRYYGRGLTQTTHFENYKRAGDYFHVDLISAPELALRKDISAGILVVGSVMGWFRKGALGNRIGNYFNATVDDPVQARGIINGDVAKNGKLIAAHHYKFLAALRAAQRPGDPIVVPPPDIPVAVSPPSEPSHGGFWANFWTALKNVRRA